MKLFFKVKYYGFQSYIKSATIRNNNLNNPKYVSLYCYSDFKIKSEKITEKYNDIFPSIKTLYNRNYKIKCHWETLFTAAVICQENKNGDNKITIGNLKVELLKFTMRPLHCCGINYGIGYAALGRVCLTLSFLSL